MKAKKISLLLAALVTAGMVLCGIASAAPEMIILEIQASGKGYDAVSDDAIVYTESKDKLDKFTLYAHCNRGSGEMTLACYNEVSGTWSKSSVTGVMVETENSLLVNFPFQTQIYFDSIGPYYSTGAVSVKIKQEEGRVTSAKMKSFAMSYYQNSQYGAAGSRQRFGAVKMKGKMLDWADVPLDIKILFD